MLNRHIHQFLIELERQDIAGMDFVSASHFNHIPKADRQDALNRGWVEGDGVTQHRAYRITPAGYTALGDNTQAYINRFPLSIEPPALAPAPSEDYDEHFDHFGVPAATPPVTVGWLATDAEASIPALLLGNDTPPAPKPAPTALCIEGCGQPRHKTYPRCKEHQQARWRDLAKRVPNLLLVDAPEAV